MTNLESVRLRDLPRLDANALLAAFGVVTGYALLGVMLAVLSGAHYAVTSTTTNVVLATFGGVFGSVSLVYLDRKLREVSA